MAEIRHRGEVREVGTGVVRVTIVASGACHSCRARQFCGMSESQEKIIEVAVDSSEEQYAVGDVVQVAEQQSMAFRAVAIAYVGALVVLLVVLMVSLELGLSEALSAGLSLLGIALYYFVVYLNRNRIKRTINFTITKS